MISYNLVKHFSIKFETREILEIEAVFSLKMKTRESVAPEIQLKILVNFKEYKMRVRGQSASL